MKVINSLHRGSLVRKENGKSGRIEIEKGNKTKHTMLLLSIAINWIFERLHKFQVKNQKSQWSRLKVYTYNNHKIKNEE